MQTKKLNQITNIVDNKLVITTEPKNFCFDLPKDADNYLEHETYAIIKIIKF